MRTTHWIYQWHRYDNERVFTRGSTPYRAFIKKNGIVKYYPYYSDYFPAYFQNKKDARTVRLVRTEVDGKIRKCEIYLGGSRKPICFQQMG